MTYTIIVYLFIMLLTIWGAYTYKSSGSRTFFYLTLFVASIIIGGRYDVGTDWRNYFDYYTYIQNNGITTEAILDNNLEPLYLVLNKLCASIGFSPSLFFTTIAFLIFIVIFQSLTDIKDIIPWCSFFFFTQLFAMSLNIQRQILAVGIFIYATKFINESRLKYILLVVIASLFHYSTILMLPLVFIKHRFFSFLDNRNIVLTLFAITLIFREYLLEFISLLPMDTYMSEKYIENFENIDETMEVFSGYGILAKNLIYVIAIYYMPNILNEYKHVDRLSSIYRLFIVGILLSTVFDISVYLSRSTLALTSLAIIIYPFLSNYLIKCKPYNLNIIIGPCIVVLSFTIFIMGIINSAGGISPYEFMWL